MMLILACSISCRHFSCGFYSTHTPLKALPNIYRVPFLAMALLLQVVSALLSCVSPSYPSSILSCRSYLPVSTSSPPQFVVSAGWLHLHQFIFMAPWGRTPAHQHQLFCTFIPPTPQAGVSMEGISRCHQVKHVSLRFSCFWESSRKQKRRKKQSRKKRGVSRWGLKRNRKSIRQWICLRSPLRSENHLRFLFLYFHPPFFSSTSYFVIWDFTHEYSGCCSNNCKRGKLGGCA